VMRGEFRPRGGGLEFKELRGVNLAWTILGMNSSLSPARQSGGTSWRLWACRAPWAEMPGSLNRMFPQLSGNEPRPRMSIVFTLYNGFTCMIRQHPTCLEQHFLRVIYIKHYKWLQHVSCLFRRTLKAMMFSSSSQHIESHFHHNVCLFAAE
jgi:hypothetical protein